MGVSDTLDRIKERANIDDTFRQLLLETRWKEYPLQEFCRICTDHGYEIGAMDMVSAGEEGYAAIRRSTNGGGENSPLLKGEDDLYEMFMIEIS